MALSELRQVTDQTFMHQQDNEDGDIDSIVTARMRKSKQATTNKQLILQQQTRYRENQSVPLERQATFLHSRLTHYLEE